LSDSQYRKYLTALNVTINREKETFIAENK